MTRVTDLINRLSRIVILTALLASCDSEQSTETPPEATTAQPPVTWIDLEEATLPRPISLRGEAERMVGQVAFVLNEEQGLGDRAVLVLNAGDAFRLPVDDDTEIQVTGELRRLIQAEINQEFNFQLDPEQFAAYENQPVIIASSMVLAPDPGDITESPSSFYGRAIAVTGEVEDVLSSSTFTLDEDKLFGAEDLLVYAPNLPVEDNSVVTIVGELRPFVKAEFEQNYELDWDLTLQEQIEAEYSEKPVFVARQIY